MGLVAEVALGVGLGRVAMPAVGHRIVGQPQDGRHHVLGRGVDGAFLEQRLEQRRQQDRQAAGHGLGDGAAERLHPARMMVVDEEVERAEELLGCLAAEGHDLPVGRVEPDQLLQEAPAPEDAHGQARMVRVDLEDRLAGRRPFARIGPTVAADRHPLARGRLALRGPAADLDDVVPVFLGQRRPAGETGQLLAYQRPDRCPDRAAAQDLHGIAPDQIQVVVGDALGVGRRMMHDHHALLGAQADALPRQQHGGIGIVELRQARLDRLARGH